MDRKNQEKIDKCVQDLKKILKAKKEIDTLNINANIDNLSAYLEYILKNDVIETMEEAFYLTSQLPVLSKALSDAINKYDIKEIRIKKNEEERKRQEQEDYYKYAGTYNSLSDVPGYGTEWNERCIPDGVSIRHRGNCRC